MYADLSGWKSPMTLAVSISFFVRESRVSCEDANQSLRDCRKPEVMATFAYASDLMKFFAGRVVELRNRREVTEREEREKAEVERARRERPEMFRKNEPATAEQIARLNREFKGFGAMA